MASGMGLAHQCPHCSKSFAYLSKLTRHLLVHADPDTVTWYRCTTCTSKFRQEASLKRHVDEVHGTPKYRCDICAKMKQPAVVVYKERRDLVEHIFHRHQETYMEMKAAGDSLVKGITVTPNVKCKSCGVELTKRYLVEHMKVCCAFCPPAETVVNATATIIDTTTMTMTTTKRMTDEEARRQEKKRKKERRKEKEKQREKTKKSQKRKEEPEKLSKEEDRKKRKREKKKARNEKKRKKQRRRQLEEEAKRPASVKVSIFV